MSRRVQLEVFELTDMTGERVELGQAELEECRLTAYEQGYTAGWDDAAAAQSDEVARLRSELGQNLQDLSFTYGEAHGHVLRSLEPLLLDMVGKVLPSLAHQSLGHMVLDHLLPLARKLADAPVSVIANPMNRDLIEDLVIRDAAFPVRFEEEPSLGEGQVYVRFGEAETRIDIDGVIAAISAAVGGFFQLEKEKEERHG